MNDFNDFNEINELPDEELFNFIHSNEDEKIEEYQFISKEIQQGDYILEKGIELYDQGLINDAIITLESAVKISPLNSKAWMHLGIALAEADKDKEACQCLFKSITLDPNNRAARIPLSISHANLYQTTESLDSLYEWLKLEETYSEIIEKYGTQKEFKELDTLKQMFKEASKLGAPNADIYTVLGILSSVSFNFDEAATYFKEALKITPRDPQLWNRLGAMLTNNENKSQNISDEAIQAYLKALEYKPKYLRARSNLAILYMSLKKYDEAAKNFLKAISMHPGATHLWFSLQHVFASMGRDDLVKKTKDRDASLFVDQDF